MKIHRHIGIIEASEELALKEALTLAAVQHEVLAFLAPNVAVLETKAARAVADELKRQDMHPKIVES